MIPAEGGDPRPSLAQHPAPHLLYLAAELAAYATLCRAVEKVAAKPCRRVDKLNLTFARQRAASMLRDLIKAYGPDAEDLAARYHFRHGGLL